MIKNPFFELGYPVHPMAHPLLPWWRQIVLHQQQDAKLVAFTFERWDDITAGQKTWEWRHDETEHDLLARKRDVLATLLEIDRTTPLDPPDPRVGLCGVRLGKKEDDTVVLVSDGQITAIQRTTTPVGYRFMVPAWSQTWPIPGFVIVDTDTPWCPSDLLPYPWIDPSLLASGPTDQDTEVQSPKITDIEAANLPSDATFPSDDLAAEGDLTDETLVHVDDDGEPLCGAGTGMMIDVRLGAAAVAQVDCPDCDTIMRVQAGG